jgi:hypothetical protein
MGEMEILDVLTPEGLAAVTPEEIERYDRRVKDMGL